MSMCFKCVLRAQDQSVSFHSGVFFVVLPCRGIYWIEAKTILKLSLKMLIDQLSHSPSLPVLTAMGIGKRMQRFALGCVSVDAANTWLRSIGADEYQVGIYTYYETLKDSLFRTVNVI